MSSTACFSTLKASMFQSFALTSTTTNCACYSPLSSKVFQSDFQKHHSNRRPATRVYADGGFQKRSRKKAAESKSKGSVSRNKSAVRRPFPDCNDQGDMQIQHGANDAEADSKTQTRKPSLPVNEKHSPQKVSIGKIIKNVDKNPAVKRADSKREETEAGNLPEVNNRSQYSTEEQKDRSELLNELKIEKEKAEIESSEAHRLEQEKVAFRNRELERLAIENLPHNMVFFYPVIAKSGQEIEIFLNKSKSTLALEPKIFMMGAFNDWRWNSFTIELEKSELPGDWWTCKLFIPKEAYNIDFVFFNGGTVYENNNQNDFSLSVDGAMDKYAFEEYLLEEKRRELEKATAEQNRRDREAALKRMEEEERVGREEDRAEAQKQVLKRRMQTHPAFQKAVKSVDGLWYFKPAEFGGGDKVKLYYNCSHRPLSMSSEIWIHGGYNNWMYSLTTIQRLFYDSSENGDWWVTEVLVPDRAFILDWVFADGPPDKAKVYDNNDYQDFHAIVPNTSSEEQYWAEEEQKIFLDLQSKRRELRESAQKKAEALARIRGERKERTMKIFLDSQKHVFYTEPSRVQAGGYVTVFYNPSNTSLNGKPEVWIRCSFNRWTHCLGMLPPQKMVPAETGSHMKVTVKVPLDAYIMDFVFSERGDEHGGCYDNRNGMDYHVPVVGGVVKEPPMHVVHIAVEMAPIAKVGGLGDVVTSLSRAVQELGHNVEVICPKYDCLDYSHVQNLHFKMEFSWGGTKIKVWHGSVEGLSVYFIEPQNGMFWAGCIYGRKDDGNRFALFCHASLEFLLQSGMHPDIIHCHDWSSAPVAWIFEENYKHYGLTNTRVVFTIHNLEFGTALIEKAMANAHKATTVSCTYAQEISNNPAIARHRYKLHGIVNGIDPNIWDPFNDPFIPVPYTHENVIEGKRAAKQELQRQLGLKQIDRPLLGVITRLTAQKGIQLIKHAIWRMLDRSGQVVLLGSAPDPRIQNDFSNLANNLHNTKGDMARLCLTYNEPLSHLIYAAADFIVVPSMFEPCGLTQLTAMRYGAVPIVRKTGGLNDTVFDVDHDGQRAEAQGLEPNGFNFEVPDSAGVDYAVNRAITTWYDNREFFNLLCKRVMDQDWSWNKPALDYMELYYCARK